MSHILLDFVNLAAAKPGAANTDPTGAVDGILTAVRNVVNPILLIVIGFMAFRFVANHKIMEAVIFFIMAVFVCVIWFNPAILANVGDALGNATGVGGDNYK